MVDNLVRYDAEQSVIGAAIIDNESFSKISFIEPKDFYAPQHKQIFSKISEMLKSGKVVDLITLAESFNDDDLECVGGFSYLAEIVKNTPSVRNVVAYADIVKDMSNRRKVVESMNVAIEKLCNLSEGTVSTITELESVLDKTLVSAADSDILTVDDLIGMTVDEMEASMMSNRTGLSTGIDEIDERLGYKYLAFGEVTALGALSKNGKTLTANTILARAKYEENETAHVFFNRNASYRDV